MSSYHLTEVEIKALRPTQMTIGMEEVRLKSKEWASLDVKERSDYLARHWFPAVKGPKNHYYIIDHHHLGLALIKEKVRTTQLVLMQDYSSLAQDEFWAMMDHRQWVHPYDESGKRCAFDEMPKKLVDLVDDPYRSLAGMVKRAGGFPKEGEPFTEFLWADFFRRRVPYKLLKDDAENAFMQAIQLAHQKVAAHLPGWSGSYMHSEEGFSTPLA